LLFSPHSIEESAYCKPYQLNSIGRYDQPGNIVLFTSQLFGNMTSYRVLKGESMFDKHLWSARHYQLI